VARQESPRLSCLFKVGLRWYSNSTSTFQDMFVTAVMRLVTILGEMNKLVTLKLRVAILY
jgi:hypothetical protein